MVGTTWVWVLAATFGCTRLAGLAPSRSLVGVSGIFVEFVAAKRKTGKAVAAQPALAATAQLFSRAFGVGIRLALCNK